MNGIGLLLAALNIWQYARQYNSAIALGNLWVAILVRNEFFGRILYLFVNTCFAKVSIALSIYLIHAHYGKMPVDSSVVQARMHICLATPWGHPFRMCGIRLCMANLPVVLDFHQLRQ